MILSLLLSSPALAHAGGTLAGVDVAVSSDGTTVYEGNFGLLLQASDKSPWEWICHEAITTADALITPRYLRADDGKLVGWITDPEQVRQAGSSVYISADGGCSWDAVDGLAGVDVTDMAVAGDLWLAAGETDLHRSVDGGETWQAWLARGGIDDLEIRDGMIWATGHDDDGLFVTTSADSGATFADRRHATPDKIEGKGQVTLTIAAARAEEAWLVAGPSTGHRVWHTTDRGATVDEVLAADILDGGISDDGAVWLLGGSGTPLRSTDGRTFVAVEGSHLGTGLFAREDDVLLTSIAKFTGELLSAVQADGSKAVVFHPTDEMGPKLCVDGTDQADLCAPLWSSVEDALDNEVLETDTGGSDGGSEDGGAGGGTDSGVTEPDGCSGCASATPLGARTSMLVATLGLLLARRRRSAPDRAATPGWTE